METVSENHSVKDRISIREARADDTMFFEKLYFLTRRGEFAQIGWDDDQLTPFLKMQFDLQTRAYAMQYPKAETFTIESGGAKVGRLITNDEAGEIRLVDIAVLPESRGLGVGSFVIKKLQTEAAKIEKPVTLQVLKTNLPALRLYEKLGFAVNGENDLYLMMRWQGA